MMDWSDWVVEDSDPADMVRRMRRVLADRERSQEEKIEALTLLTNLADDASLAVLRWYNEHADPGMEVASMLALIEADRLNQPPHVEPWHEQLLEAIHEVGEHFTTLGLPLERERFRAVLADTLRARNWLVEEEGRALLKYEGQVVDIVPVELVVNAEVLVGFWDDAAEEAAWQDAEIEEEGGHDPFDYFYAVLRTANLPWGIQVDLSGQGILTDIVQNIELDRGRPKVEYILATPRSS